MNDTENEYYPENWKNNNLPTSNTDAELEPEDDNPVIASTICNCDVCERYRQRSNSR